MRSVGKRATAVTGERIATLEVLVDELIKDSPHENRIRIYMEAAGLPYSADPIERMNRVLAALNGASRAPKRRGGEHGKDL